MKKHKLTSEILGIVLIFIGIIFYLTPIPGTTVLIILGLVWVIGVEKTMSFFKKHLSKENFKRFKIRSIIRKINTGN
jgi:uncharacterized membrane protein HdeD (DUF308 family)